MKQISNGEILIETRNHKLPSHYPKLDFRLLIYGILLMTISHGDKSVFIAGVLC